MLSYPANAALAQMTTAILGAVQAVGVLLRRPFPREPEPEEHYGAGGHVGQVVDRVAEQPDRAGQDGQQQFCDAGRSQPDRADRDRPVGLPAFLHVIPGAREGKRGGGVTQACGFMHAAMMTAVRLASKIAQCAAAASCPAGLPAAAVWWHV
jgi:hypothetical protein